MGIISRLRDGYRAFRGDRPDNAHNYIYKLNDSSRQFHQSNTDIFGNYEYRRGWRMYDLYETLREAFPMLNRAISLYTRLVGYPHIISENPRIVDTLTEFNDSIKVNDLQRGLSIYLKQVVDSYLETGMTFTEIVPDLFMQNINRLGIADTKNMRFVRDKSSGELQFAQVSTFTITPTPFANQEWIVYCANDLRKGDPVGRSIFDSLPIIAQIYFRVLKAVESQAERLQNVSFYTKSKTDINTPVKPADISNFYGSIQTALTNWQKMKSIGEIADIMIPALPGTDVELKVVGGDAQLMDIEIPWRMIMSQFEAATGLPGFLVGYYGGASSFRLTQHQSDILSQDIKSIRNDIAQNLFYIHDRQLIMKGITDTEYDYDWTGVSLQDIVETARAELMTAQAQKSRADMLINLLMNGMIPEELFAQELINFEIINGELLKSYGLSRFINNVKTKGLKALIGLTVKDILSKEK